MYPPPPPPESKGKSVVVWIILGIVIGFLLGFGLEYSIATSEISSLKDRISTLENNLIQCQNNLESLSQEYQQLSSEYSILMQNYTTLSQEYNQLLEEHLVLINNYTQLEQKLAELEELNEKFQNQTREVLYYRVFTIYNYKTGEYWYAWYRIRASDYYHYRFDVETHTPARLNDRFTEVFLRKAVLSWRDAESAVIREIADDLWYVSGGDEELFVNLVIQFVHQIYYNVTSYTKYPVETLVEGSGDCDNLAVLAASILNAKGFDVLLMLVRADGGGHAMLAVNVSPPDDLFTYGNRKYRYYYEYDGVKYWIIEATWSRIGENWIDPATPQAYDYLGSFVGDNPWETIEVVSVIEFKG